MYNWHIKILFSLGNWSVRCSVECENRNTAKQTECQNVCVIFVGFTLPIIYICCVHHLDLTSYLVIDNQIQRLYKALPFCFGCCVHISPFFFLRMRIPHNDDGVCFACLFGAFLVVSFRLQFGWMSFSFRLYLLFISIGVDGFVVLKKRSKKTASIKKTFHIFCSSWQPRCVIVCRWCDPKTA